MQNQPKNGRYMQKMQRNIIKQTQRHEKEKKNEMKFTMQTDINWDNQLTNLLSSTSDRLWRVLFFVDVVDGRTLNKPLKTHS